MAAHAALRAEPDLVIHLAAVTGFDADLASFAAVDVAGTAHVLAFAAGDRPVPVLHVSTAYVCGAASGPVAEDDPTGAGPFANGYEASKAQRGRRWSNKPGLAACPWPSPARPSSWARMRTARSGAWMEFTR